MPYGEHHATQDDALTPSIRAGAGIFHQGSSSRRLRVTADSEQYPETDTVSHTLPADALEKGPYKRHLVLAVDNISEASEEACDWLLEQVRVRRQMMRVRQGATYGVEMRMKVRSFHVCAGAGVP